MFLLSACKFPDALVGLIVANAVDGLVVVDGPPDFPK